MKQTVMWKYNKTQKFYRSSRYVLCYVRILYNVYMQLYISNLYTVYVLHGIFCYIPHKVQSFQVYGERWRTIFFIFKSASIRSFFFLKYLAFFVIQHHYNMCLVKYVLCVVGRVWLIYFGSCAVSVLVIAAKLQIFCMICHVDNNRWFLCQLIGNFRFWFDSWVASNLFF